MKIWLEPSEVKLPHLEEVRVMEPNSISVYNSRTLYDDSIILTYKQVDLRNSAFEYVYVLDGFLDYFLKTYNISS